jgi:hypothetical protein
MSELSLAQMDDAELIDADTVSAASIQQTKS